jgi:hypothetical protein
LNVETLERVASTKHGRVGEDRIEATKIGNGKLDKVRPTRKWKRKPLYPKRFDLANLGPPPDPKRDLISNQQKRTREMHKLGVLKD